jgi:ligand-binding sensor domain-containing protein
MYKSFLTFIIILAIGIPLTGQMTFSRLSVTNGLSQSTVLSVCKDSRGYMWFGTRNCLNRYDSRNFKIYQNDPSNPASISSNDYINALYEDKSKNLWIGTQYGLNRYIPESDSFERIFSKPENGHNLSGHSAFQPGSLSSNSIKAIVEDRQGNLWVGTENEGLNLYEPTNESFTHFTHSNSINSLSHNNIRKLIIDRDGVLWIGTQP